VLCETNKIRALLNVSLSLEGEEEVRKERRKGEEEKGSEVLYREANIRKSSECRNAYTAYTHALLEQEKATQRRLSIQQIQKSMKWLIRATLNP